MKKKFQVFISSTYRDLRDERMAVAQNVLELNHIPVGMEFFGASDLQQLEFIKAEIDQTDYYMLIIGGKYGSIDTASGKSYTQLEYEYAVSKKIPVLVFLRANRHELPIEQRETNGTSIQLLDTFIEAASGSKRIRAEWNSISDLVLQSANALTKEINRTATSAIGWVRADSLTSESDQVEIANLRKQLEEIESRSDEYFANPKDAQSIYDSIGQIVETLNDPAVDVKERNELRRIASARLQDLINLGLQSEAPPNLLFNAQVNAARLEMSTLGLQLATICNYQQSTNSHTLALLHRQCQATSSYEVYEEDGSRYLRKASKSPASILDDALNKALMLAADTPLPQCEIVYSQVWNIAQNLREQQGVEKMLAVLLSSKCSRKGDDIPSDVASYITDISSLQEYDWSTQKGKPIPSYLVGKIADCVAFLSPSGWKEQFLQFAKDSLEINSKESPMVTWSEHYRRDLLQTAVRTNLIHELNQLINEVLHIDINEFAEYQD